MTENFENLEPPFLFQAQQMAAELLPYIEDLLALGHMGVVVRLAETAVRFEIKQKKILKALLQAFHCDGKDKRSSAVALISSLTTYDIFFGSKPNEKHVENNDASEVSLVSPLLFAINKFIMKFKLYIVGRHRAGVEKIIQLVKYTSKNEK